jgi:hypothetical protein
MADDVSFSEDGEKEKIERLLQENIKLTQEIHKMSKRVNRYVTIQHVLSIVYFLLIVVPLVVGAIYLPTFLNNYLGPYLELMNDNRSALDSVGNFNNSEKLIDILDQAQKILNNK